MRTFAAIDGATVKRPSAEGPRGADGVKRVVAMAGLPLRRIVFAVFVGTWAVRLVFLGVPEPLSLDETSALTASEYTTASSFVATADWAERWQTVKDNPFAHVFWIVPHLVWGYLFPSNGQMAYVLTEASALIAMVALAGAARHLYGDLGLLLGLLIPSVSPLFLNYTVRAIGTMPSTMWICLALLVLSAPAWSTLRWVAGGLCLGLAFATHAGAGPAVLAIACGLGVSVARGLAVTGGPWPERARHYVIGPALGAIAAVAVLLPIELAASRAGSTYAGSLVGHSMLSFERWLGPYGLWIRELFELDPLLQMLWFATLLYMFRVPSLSRLEKVGLTAGSALVLALLVVSTDRASPRVFVSLALFALLGALVAVSRFFERGWLATPGSDGDLPSAPQARAPFDRWALVVGIVVVAIVLTVWRSVSNMPRLAFPAWPLLVLGLLGLVFRVLPAHGQAAGRAIAVLGSLLFLVGAGATYHAKSTHARAQAYSVQHPYLTELTYQSVWGVAGAVYGFGALSRRPRYDVVVVGPPATLYPASAYEEDPHKILIYRDWLKRFNLDGVLAAEALMYGSVFFEQNRTPTQPAPPPGTPEVPAEIAVDMDGTRLESRIHPYRGLDLRFPRRPRHVGPVEMSATLVLPAQPGKDGVLGFEVMALAPRPYAGTRLALSAFQGGRQLQPAITLVARSEHRAGDAAIRLYQMARQQREPFQVVQFPVRADTRRQPIRIVVTLDVPNEQPSPPVSCYIRRPYIRHP